MSSIFFICMGCLGSFFLSCGILNYDGPPPRYIQWFKEHADCDNFFVFAFLTYTLAIPALGPLILGLTLAYYSL